MKEIHGGDIYRNHVSMDFSVNVNPFGMPKAIEQALHEAVKSCCEYPDMHTEKLKNAVGVMLSASPQYLLFGNGASELFMAIVHAIQPKKTVIPIPSFYGYEYAAGALGGEIVYYPMRETNRFCLKEDFFEVLTEDVDMLFLANPNNPTGTLMGKAYLRKLLNHCRERGIHVVIDECFIEFCGTKASMLPEIKEFDNLIIVRAFTKIFAIPGVRLGYLICSNHALLARVERQLPEWNVSVLAQTAGCVCAKQGWFIGQTAAYVKEERQFLTEKLKTCGFRVFPSEANFLLLYSRQPLYEQLLEYGILIRNCRNFRGLSEGYYRIAVKSRRDNETLLQIIGEVF